MNTRTIIIATIIIVLLGAGGYWYTTRQAPAGPQAPTPQFPGEGQPVTGGGVPTTPEVGAGETFIPGEGAVLPRLYELHKVPVAGATLVETKDKKGVTTNITVRYIERGLGHIYETPLATFAETRIVGDTHTRLSEALWGNAGKSVVIRFLDETGGQTIKTRVLNLFTQADTLQTEEVFLPDHIPFMAVAGDGSDRLFYLENSAIAASGAMVTFKNTGKATVFGSSFTEWLPEFPTKNLITLTTRPSSAVPGHLFFVNPTTKTLTKVLSDINGLTTLTSKDGATVLYSESSGQGVALFAYDVARKETRVLSLQTLPEKCAWSSKAKTVAYCAAPRVLPPALYPDQWYQGLVSFADDIWRIDTKTGEATRVFTGAFDVTSPVLASDDSYIIFVNKSTGTPWVYRLTEEVLATPTTTPAQATTTTSVTPAPTEGMTKVR